MDIPNSPDNYKYLEDDNPWYYINPHLMREFSVDGSRAYYNCNTDVSMRFAFTPVPASTYIPEMKKCNTPLWER